MCNLAINTDRELTKYEMESAEIVFGNIETLLQTFGYNINEFSFSFNETACLLISQYDLRVSQCESQLAV